MWNNDVPVAIVFIINILKHSAGSNMLSHDRCVKSKTNKYHSKGDEFF